MFELLLGIVIGTGVGTFYHERTHECFQPVMFELVELKNRLQRRFADQREQREGQPRTRYND